MTEQPGGFSNEDLQRMLSRSGVPQSIFFYIILGVISSARKLMIKAAQEGCPPEDMACVDFTDIQAGTELDSPYQVKGLTFNASGGEKLRVIGWGVPVGQSKLSLPQKGLEISFSYPTKRVLVRCAQYTSQPLMLQGFDGDQQVAQVSAPPVQNQLHTLKIESDNFTRIMLSGAGNEGLLYQVCIDERPVEVK
jgi:hypothetical protein